MTYTINITYPATTYRVGFGNTTVTITKFSLPGKKFSKIIEALTGLIVLTSVFVWLFAI